MNHGNQHVSERARLCKLLRVARDDLARARCTREGLLYPRSENAALARQVLARHHIALARQALALFRFAYDRAPASTKRRWKCGR